MGHQVRCYEELGSWSLSSLMKYEGERAIAAIDEFRSAYPELDIRFYQSNEAGFEEFLEDELRETDLVLLHEWNEPRVVNAVLALKQKLGFTAFFHDSHHRAYTRAGEILRFHLHLVDGVLAFGEPIRRIYLDGFGVRRAWTFHEAADVETFRPLPFRHEADVLWIGNWGDEERTRELEQFLISPARDLHGLRTLVFGVRYPESAQQALKEAGIEYRGYLPNLRTPQMYAATSVAIHVPRRQYANGLGGIPTIRVFEALACGVPLICSPWKDEEGLFHSGEDFIVVQDREGMRDAIAHLLRDARAREQLGQQGRETICRRHTCAHRAEQLISIYEEIAA